MITVHRLNMQAIATLTRRLATDFGIDIPGGI